MNCCYCPLLHLSTTTRRTSRRQLHISCYESSFRSVVLSRLWSETLLGENHSQMRFRAFNSNGNHHLAPRNRRRLRHEQHRTDCLESRPLQDQAVSESVLCPCLTKKGMRKCQKRKGKTERRKENLV